jgi:hypothetical protein
MATTKTLKVRITAVKQIAYTTNGNPRFELTTVDAAGAVETFKTKANVYASNNYRSMISWTERKEREYDATLVLAKTRGAYVVEAMNDWTAIQGTELNSEREAAALAEVIEMPAEARKPARSL